MKKLSANSLLLLVALSSGFLLIMLLGLSQSMGRNIPTDDITSDYAKGLFWAIGLFAVVIFNPLPLKLRWHMAAQWLIRISITLGFMLYYEYNYGLDAYHYFLLSGGDVQMPALTDMKGTLMVGWMAKVFRSVLPFFDSYHALKVLWSLFGLLGVYFFYTGYSNYSGHKDNRIFWLIGLYPSILFWSSILGKDPLTFLGTSLFYFSALGLLKKFEVKYLAVMAFAVLLMAAVRMWLVGIFMVPFAIVVLVKSQMQMPIKIVMAIAFVGIAGVFGSSVLDGLYIQDQQQLLQFTSNVSRAWSTGGSGQEVPEFNSAADLIRFLPQGISTALFRPLPGEVNNIFGIMAGLENLFLLVLYAWALFSINSKIARDPFVLFTLLTVILWGSFYGYISYQNLGSAVRFRLQILPMLVFLPIFIIRSRALQHQEAR